MPNRTGVAHPRLMEALRPQFYTSTLSIETYTAGQDTESGEEVLTWAPLSGHGAIPAVVAPVTVQSVGSVEERRPTTTVLVNTWQISLNGLWPQVEPKMRGRFEDGRLFDILGVEADSHLQMTRLKAEEVL